MIIDLTNVVNFIHDCWDAVGVILLCMLSICVPLVIVVASSIKIKEKMMESDND